MGYAAAGAPLTEWETKTWDEIRSARYKCDLLEGAGCGEEAVIAVLTGCLRGFHVCVYFRCVTHASWLKGRWGRNNLMCQTCMKEQGVTSETDITDMLVDDFMMSVLHDWM